MNVQYITKHLKNNAKIIAYDTVSSTNTVAKELAQRGAREFTVVTAKSQTNGKGRLGRSFISNSENGLYMSVILKPNISAEKCVDITVLSAVAVLEAIEEISDIKSTIKWINDIYINEKKNGVLNDIITQRTINSCPFSFSLLWKCATSKRNRHSW